MAEISKIRADHVIGAVALLDDPVEGPRLRKELGFGSATNYRLVWEGRFFDSKPVVGIANGLLTGTNVDRRGFSGGDARVASLLTRLGFVVDDGWLYEITRLRVHRVNGRPTPYQYVVLLWALSRAVRSSDPRMIPFSEVRDELAELLAPFAIAHTPPDPAMPWLALRGPLWDLDLPQGATVANESEVKRLDVAGGLSERVYASLRGGDWSLSRWAAAVDVIERFIGAEPAFYPLLSKLHAPGVGRTYAVPAEDGRVSLWNPSSQQAAATASPEVADAIVAVDEVANPRRQSRRRLSAADNKAIEQRAVRVVRHHFEKVLGYETQDVGDTQSYDVHATRDGELLKIEVKGTTTDGSEVVLTANEVALHQVAYPNNAFAIVRRIALDRTVEPPIADGGELLLHMPWKVETERLRPIAFTYDTALPEAEQVS